MSKNLFLLVALCATLSSSLVLSMDSQTPSEGAPGSNVLVAAAAASVEATGYISGTESQQGSPRRRSEGFQSRGLHVDTRAARVEAGSFRDDREAADSTEGFDAGTTGINRRLNRTLLPNAAQRGSSLNDGIDRDSSSGSSVADDWYVGGSFSAAAAAALSQSQQQAADQRRAAAAGAGLPACRGVSAAGSDGDKSNLEKEPQDGTSVKPAVPNTFSIWAPRVAGGAIVAAGVYAAWVNRGRLLAGLQPIADSAKKAVAFKGWK